MKKRVLIFGGLGFIGTNLTLEFLKNQENYHVTIYDLKDINDFPLIKQKVEYIQKDYFNDDFSWLTDNKQFDFIIHCISSTIPSNSNSKMIFDIQTNLIPLIKILEKIHDKKSQIVFISTGGAIYGINNSRHISEDEPTNPISSYGIVKLSQEKYIQLFHHLYGLSFLILRPSNPYGPYHTSNRQGIINVFVKRVLRNEPIVVYGKGDIIRDYIYIKDLAEIVVKLIEKDCKNKIFNVGSQKGYSILEIIEIIEGNIDGFTTKFIPGRKADVPKVVLNNHLLRETIDFNFTPLKDGIENVIKWEKNRY